MRRFLACSGVAAMLVGLASAGLRADDEPRPKGSPNPEAGADGKAASPTNLDIDALLNRSRGGPEHAGMPPEKKYRDFAEVVRGAEKIDGLFTLHKKDDHLYAEIKPFQFDQPLLMPITIARGLGKTGEPLGWDDDEMVLVFKKVGDRVQLIRRNIRFKAPHGTPLDKSVRQNYTDSVLMALPIVSVNPAGGMSTVIDLSDIFMTDFAQLGLGFFDRSRSSWHRVKGFPNNLELEVEATYGGGRGGRLGFSGDATPDARGVTLVIHYSLLKAPDQGYRPRVADDRIGHWITATKDFGSDDLDSNFTRQIHRWRLEKADHRAKLSPPKKQIIWWVEDTVPHEYRPYVEAGILEWNKAFEKVGFRNAMAVRWQNPGEEFDPEDANYCTFRWVTSDGGYARTCYRANPLTGEIIDGDIIFDASFIRAWKQEYALLVGTVATPTGGSEARPLAVGEVISPILASKYGFGQLLPARPDRPGALGASDGRELPEVIPSSWDPLEVRLNRRLAWGQTRTCQFRAGLQDDFVMAALALADKSDKPGELPEEFIGQGLKEVVMHEVGHSIGLRHNFKASTMLTAEQLHDTNLTRSKGLVGSVMDYNAVNIAPKGKPQGDYFSTTIGPYDYWAIEYAYKAIDGNEEAELRKIASRAPEGELAFATDEDAALNNDPLVNRFDLGSDPCQFARDRIGMATDLLKTLDEKVVKDGESWTRNRRAFGTLLNQWGNGAALIAAYIGGQSVSRDHKGDKGARDPVVPVAGAKQRECLKFLVENILSDGSFKFSPGLLRRLATEKWSDWGNHAFGSTVDFPVLERVMAIQKIALSHCLDPRVLARLQNQELQADPGTDPLRMDEVFRALSDGVWSELDAPAEARDQSRKVAVSTIRRNLQREYLQRLGTIVLGEQRGPRGGDAFPYVLFVGGGRYPADARALARLHLKQTGEKIGKVLEAKDVTLDDQTRAHLEECRQRIAKILDSSFNANEP